MSLNTNHDGEQEADGEGGGSERALLLKIRHGLWPVDSRRAINAKRAAYNRFSPHSVTRSMACQRGGAKTDLGVWPIFAPQGLLFQIRPRCMRNILENLLVP